MDLETISKSLNATANNNNVLQAEELSQYKQQIAELTEKIKIVTKEREQYYKELEFFKKAINSLPNPIHLKDNNANFIFFNECFERNFSISSNDYIGKTTLEIDFMPDEDRAKFHDEDVQLIEKNLEVHYEKPFIFSDSWVHETLYWAKGFTVESTGEKGLIGEIVDISEEKLTSRDLQIAIEMLTDANDTISKLSKTDTLTQINNRSILLDSFNSIVADCKANDFDFSIMLADVDHFKQVNDVFGHNTGDEVLKKVAHTLKSNARKDDIHIRYGGEEFLVFLPYTNKLQAIASAERISKVLRNTPILPNGKNITISIGVTQYIKDEKLETILNRADTAMYAAKNGGRDQVQSL